LEHSTTGWASLALTTAPTQAFALYGEEERREKDKRMVSELYIESKSGGNVGDTKSFYTKNILLKNINAKVD